MQVKCPSCGHDYGHQSSASIGRKMKCKCGHKWRLSEATTKEEAIEMESPFPSSAPESGRSEGEGNQSPSVKGSMKYPVKKGKSSRIQPVSKTRMPPVDSDIQKRHPLDIVVMVGIVAGVLFLIFTLLLSGNDDSSKSLQDFAQVDDSSKVDLENDEFSHDLSQRPMEEAKFSGLQQEKFEPPSKRNRLSPTPEDKEVSSREDLHEPKRTGSLKVYSSLSEAPQGVTLYRNLETGEIVDPSGLPEVSRTRITKNPNVWTLIED